MWQSSLTDPSFQISNLNAKIAEDNEELMASKSETSSTRDRYQSKVIIHSKMQTYVMVFEILIKIKFQIDELQQKAEAANKESSAHLEKVQDKEKEISKLVRV